MAEQTIIWTATAYRDLQNIVDFIAEDSMYYALAFYENVMEKAKKLTEFPHRGCIVPEMDDPGVREVFIHRYRLIYQILNDRVIIHGGRNLTKN